MSIPGYTFPSYTVTVFLALFLLSATSALADAEDDPKAQARAVYAEGVSRFGARDYEGALAAFERSYELKPNNAVLFNIAMCRKALFDHVGSLAAFERFIAAGGVPSLPEKLTLAEAAIEEMEPLVGAVQIRQAPEGALFSIDNADPVPIPSDERVRVLPGRHRICVLAEGHGSLCTVITSAAGATVDLVAPLDVRKPDALKPPAPPTEPERDDANASISETSAVLDNGNGGHLKPLGGWLTGIGSALGAAATVTGILWAVDYRQATKISETWSEADRNRYETLYERIPIEERLTIAFAAASATLIASGIVLLVIDTQREKHKDLAIGPQGIVIRF